MPNFCRRCGGPFQPEDSPSTRLCPKCFKEKGPQSPAEGKPGKPSKAK